MSAKPQEWVITSVDGFYAHGGADGEPYYFETAPGYAARMSREDAEGLAVLIAARHPARIGFLHIVAWNKFS